MKKIAVFLTCCLGLAWLVNTAVLAEEMSHGEKIQAFIQSPRAELIFTNNDVLRHLRVVITNPNMEGIADEKLRQYEREITDDNIQDNTIISMVLKLLWEIEVSQELNQETLQEVREAREMLLEEIKGSQEEIIKNRAEIVKVQEQLTEDRRDLQKLGGIKDGVEAIGKKADSIERKVDSIGSAIEKREADREPPPKPEKVGFENRVAKLEKAREEDEKWFKYRVLSIVRECLAEVREEQRAESGPYSLTIGMAGSWSTEIGEDERSSKPTGLLFEARGRLCLPKTERVYLNIFGGLPYLGAGLELAVHHYSLEIGGTTADFEGIQDMPPVYGYVGGSLRKIGYVFFVRGFLEKRFVHFGVRVPVSFFWE